MGTLPAELTSFVGRREELRDIRVLLAAGRLVTLTGPGGVGKTRLGIRTAAAVRRTFPDGVWLTELAVVHDPGQVARTVGATFGLRDADDDPVGRLTAFLQDRSLLLVLDNCEHLHDASADLVERLLKAAPGVRILATSRHRLAVDGEHVYAVRPLATAGDLPDAVKLFEDRAAAVTSGFTVTEANAAQIVEICRRLDGIPLAVELAAAWLRVLSVEALLDRMDTLAPGRQQILDWSYDLCTTDERTLWARLSVFTGGFDLTAAESVCGADLQVLSGLVDKSIVQSDGGSGTGRFQLLETIRQYGLQRLRSADEENAVRLRHLQHYLELAERCGQGWRRGDGQAEAHARTQAEHANLRSALEFSLGTAGLEADGLHLAVALHYHWLFCGHAAEGRSWLELALEHNPEPSRDRAEAQWITAFALSLMGYGSTIYSYGREAEAWARENDDREVLAYSLLMLGAYWFLSGDAEKAEPFFAEAITHLEALDEPNSVLLQLHGSMAQLQTWQGHPEAGLALARRALELCDASGEQFARSGLLFARSLAQWRLGSYQEAADGLTEGIRLAQTFNDVLGAVTWLELLCWTTAAMGRHMRAAELLGVADRTWPMGGGRSMLGWLHMTDTHEACERDVMAALGPERYRAAFERGAAAATEFDQAIAFAVGLEVDRPQTGPAGPGPLSERELQVAELVAQGMTNREIAARLVISRRTAESHVVHILDKLGFSSRSQIATWLATRQR